MIGKGPLIPFPERRSARSGRSGCERILPGPLGYGATRQIGRNVTLIYPTLGLGPGHVPQRSDIFPHGRDLAGFEPRIFRFRRGGLDVSGFRRIHWATVISLVQHHIKFQSDQLKSVLTLMNINTGDIQLSD